MLASEWTTKKSARSASGSSRRQEAFCISTEYAMGWQSPGPRDVPLTCACIGLSKTSRTEATRAFDARRSATVFEMRVAGPLVA